jgi:hypothetical protein
MPEGFMAKLIKNINVLNNINVLYLSGNLVKFPGLNGDLTGYSSKESYRRGLSKLREGLNGFSLMRRSVGF